MAITGATGFLGWHLCEGFRAAGWDVTAIVRPGNRKPLPDGITATEAPLQAAPLTLAMEGASLVVHAAGVAHAGNEAAFQAVNVAGTQAVVEAALAAGCRLIFISSQAAAGAGTPEHPAREADTPKPLTAYGRSKLAAEAMVRQGSLPSWTVLRPSSIYGPRDRQFLPVFRMASRGVFLLASSPSAFYTLVQVDDVVRAVVAAATDPSANRQTLFVGHPQPVSTSELLGAIATAVGRSYHPRSVPRFAIRLLATAGELSWKLGRPPLVDRARFIELYAEGWVCGVDRIREVLGVTATTQLAEGLEQTARWYKREGWL